MADDKHVFRKPLIVANWKMNKTGEETENFIKEFASKFPAKFDREVVLCPPFPSLEKARSLLAGTPIGLGAQNLNENKEGAYTGEVSAAMLKAVGCQWVIIGHSERRQYYGETDSLVNKKLLAALNGSLLPIVCVGETLEQRESNKTASVVSRQVKGALADLPSTETKKLTFAYEPVWAIGTGKTATPEQAQDVHLLIRDIIKEFYGSQIAHLVRVLYGGSVKPDNMADLMNCEDIDGGLVGGASLKADSFLRIIDYKSKALSEK